MQIVGFAYQPLMVVWASFSCFPLHSNNIPVILWSGILSTILKTCGIFFLMFEVLMCLFKTDCWTCFIYKCLVNCTVVGWNWEQTHGQQELAKKTVVNRKRLCRCFCLFIIIILFVSGKILLVFHRKVVIR